jgi:sugar phosphate isomerase/epimerase
MDSRDRSTHVDVLRSSLEFASHINASALVYHPGRYVPEELFFFGQALKQPEDKKKYLRDMEASAIRLVSEDFPNVLICMENARPYLFHSPYCYAEFLESLKEQVVKIDRPNVRMTIDFGHLYLAAGFYDFEPIQSIRGASALIAHAHIHDNFGIPTYYNETEPSRLIPFGKGDCHMPIGWGKIPVHNFLSAFVVGYEGALLLETGRRYLEHAAESRARLQLMCDSIISASLKAERAEEKRVA